jgi:uncharacterized protein YceK
MEVPIMRIACVTFFLIIAIALAGCSSDRYLVRTKDGKEYVSENEPQYDKKTQTYKVTDQNGSTWVINKADVESIGIAGSKKEAAMMETEQKQTPAPAAPAQK